MTVNEFIQFLGAKLQLKNFDPDAEGIFSIRADTIKVRFVPDASGLALSARARLGHIETNDVQMQETLLTANLYGDGSGGSALGVDTAGHVWLSEHFECSEATQARFLQALERFINHAEYWQFRLGGEFDEFGKDQVAHDACARPQAITQRALRA